MAIEFTEKQKKILNARNHNVLVSAAAGSGKTAVLVERIVRMISEGDHPLDIDRLLVVTFTRAAAAQMRERIARAISARLEEKPGDRHLQRQETLLHHAQITTIDSFCTFLLRNNFSEIGLDPGFRQMDDTQSALLEKDVMKRFLEEQYEGKDPDFLTCVDYFCPGRSDEKLEDLIRALYQAADSHPYPEVWLEERRGDYQAGSAEELLSSSWYADYLRDQAEVLPELAMLHQAMLRITGLPDGPFPYQDLLEREEEELFGKLSAMAESAMKETDVGKLRGMLLSVADYPMDRLPVIRSAEKQGISTERKEEVAGLRKEIRGRMQDLGAAVSEDPEKTALQMQQAAGPLDTLIRLTLGYRSLLQQVKKERNVIDFSDLEHMALQILVERKEDGTLVPRKTAEDYRNFFDEILIDEYQDSNEVQELLLSSISGEREGRYARFMVGDVKQSIYRFRNARPEIFEEKYEAYQPEDPETERIDLDQNFRSRREVLDAANGVFSKIMRREIGGVEYDEAVSLKPGAVYPDGAYPDENEGKMPHSEGSTGTSPWKSELLLVDGAAKEASGEEGGEDSGEDDPVAELSSARKEALAVAQRIRELVGSLPVRVEETGELRPARYGDIVILLRSTSGRQDAFREIFEKEGIPLYLDYKGGYFAAEEIRTVLQALRVIDNPRQDIPLYGVLRGYFGGFSRDEIGTLRSLLPGGREEGKLLYDCVLAAAGEPAEACGGKESGSGAEIPMDFVEADPSLRDHCRQFLSWLDSYRSRMETTPIHELLGDLVRSTGYENYVRALPAGARRAANLHSLLVKAEAFEQGDYAGLFRFLRYIDQMHEFDVDYGEASVLDEHADVVRLVTIHKSKGLEYPICFVCGLGSRHNFTRDLTGTLLVDTDLGLGVSYVAPELRSSTTTLRQKAVAAKIARDCLGEELRILYVAMTRAKEKLILCGYARDADKLEQKIRTAMTSVCLPARHLPVPVIRKASGFLPLVLESMEAMKAEGQEPILLQRVTVSDLRLSELENQAVQGTLLQTLRLVENGEMRDLPDSSLAGELEKRFSWRYPYEDLQGLYTKTTVTELKRASMLGENERLQPGEGAADLFSDQNAGPAEQAAGGFAERNSGLDGTVETGRELPVPRFAAQEEAGGAKASQGTAFGVAVHRMCEKIDYRAWSRPGEVSAEELEGKVSALLGAGTITGAQAEVLTPELFLPFLRSPVAARMAQADQKGLLKREQPFVLGIPASRLNPEFPGEETILIQGIIDAFFVEGEGSSRHVVVVDYKTDRVRKMEQLEERYRVQLDYYAEALSKLLQLPVTEKILYSFRLGKEKVLR